MKKRAASIIVILACVLLLLLSLLAFSNRLDPCIDLAGRGAVTAENDAYLSTALAKATATFAAMSLLKAGLDVIEGSEVGASFGLTAQIEVGDFVQPVYDYVDIAWRTLLVGSVALLGIRYLLEAAAAMDSLVLGGALLAAVLALAAHVLLPRWRRLGGVLTDVLSASVVAALALYYLLPLSVWGAAHLSRAITAPAIAEAEQGFRDAQERLFPERHETAKGWIGRIEDFQDRIEKIAVYLRQKADVFILWTVQLIAGYIFDCIVFPAALFALLLWLTRGVTRYIFQRNLQRRLGDEIRQALSAGRGR